MALVLFVGGASRPSDAESAADSTEAIAQRICSFPRFVEWPGKKMAPPGSPFVIGVLGPSGVIDALREIIQDRRIKDHPVVLKQVLAKEELPGCHVVFIPRTENARLDTYLRMVKREGVLTVGEGDKFMDRGGVINLVDVGGVMRFQIDLDNARRERLVVDPQLLQLALPRNMALAPPDFSAAVTRP